MIDYEEACPISKASSILSERWTLQIIREMLFGASRFSDLQKFLPKISPSLLNSRLKHLEEEGLITKRRIPQKMGNEYLLTPCGQALRPVLFEMGKWGMQWALESLSEEQLNLLTLVRDFALALDVDQLPGRDVTIQLTTTVNGVTERNFILVRDGKTQTCEEDVGHDVDVYLVSDLETLGNIWYGRVSLIDAQKSGRLKVTGTPAFTRYLSRWLKVSQLAEFDFLGDKKPT